METRHDAFIRNAFSVTELNDQIKRLLEDNFDFFWVEGEVSNLRRPASGHLYFTLKDEKSQISAVIFRSAFVKKSFLRTGASLFNLEEGMSILCRARLSVYQPRGEYHLLVDALEPIGLGALQKAFEQLKARLQAEGLFDAACKKEIPFLPRRIGVITSPTGAVIKDILHITRRRFSSVDIIVAPVRVQGMEAADEIIRAIADMNAVGDIDVIILARGGGSLEDIAPFNDEGVARAIFNSRIPIVSAIGHETDWTIADFVADLRAPTPSTAAELVTPARTDLMATLGNMHAMLINHQHHLMENLLEKLRFVKRSLPSPRRHIADLRMSIGEKLNQMQKILAQKRIFRRQVLFNIRMHLRLISPATRIRNRQTILKNLRKEIFAACGRTLNGFYKRIEADMIMLDTLSPFAVLRRGYGIVRIVPEGAIVRNAEKLAVRDTVDVTLATGGFQAQVTAICGSEQRWQRKNSRKR
jgi:exodeoxyribonuclease VII large subunit